MLFLETEKTKTLAYLVSVFLLLTSSAINKYFSQIKQRLVSSDSLMRSKI